MTKKQISREGFQKLERQLEHFISVRRAEVAQKLKEARAFGDLSENAEYDEAKNEQGILEAQIAELENTINNAEVVDGDKISTNEVGVGSIVTIRQIGKEKVQKLQIVGTSESDPVIGKVSDESPIGQAVMKKKIGDTFTVEAPIGELEYEVLKISK